MDARLLLAPLPLPLGPTAIQRPSLAGDTFCPIFPAARRPEEDPLLSFIALPNFFNDIADLKQVGTRVEEGKGGRKKGPGGRPDGGPIPPTPVTKGKICLTTGMASLQAGHQLAAGSRGAGLLVEKRISSLVRDSPRAGKRAYVPGPEILASHHHSPPFLLIQVYGHRQPQQAVQRVQEGRGRHRLVHRCLGL